MKNIDERILSLMKSRGIDNDQKIEEFVNPSFSNFGDANKILGIPEAKQRIEKAIKQGERIVIYGDYDTDGVCASAILYLFLKERGITSKVFIPNRFEDGYGLSEDTIIQIAQNEKPDLLITVDCGITAIAEVEQLKKLGIDVIITDHHEPLQELPNCIVVDAKVKQDYAFDGFCGAGIVLKLVQSMSTNFKKYIDIAAVATIGDIVPLVSENRIIAYHGLQQINDGKSQNKAIKAFKARYLGENKLTSSETSFKIVPRLNSTGRMGDSMLAFNLIVEDDEQKIEKYLDEIEDVNTKRLEAINKSMQVIEQDLRSMNLNENPALVFVNNDFHQGVLGILASKLASEFNRPAFIFTETEQGFLKGSVRSTDNIDIHEILVQLQDLCLNIGGHKMAGGLSISKEKFDEFKQKLNSIMAKIDYTKPTTDLSYDILVEDSDLTYSFAKQIEIFEPTGNSNEKPLLMISGKDFVFKQTNSIKHYQVVTPTKKYMICFFGYKYRDLFSQSSPKQIYFNMSTEKYAGAKRIRAVVRDIKCKAGEKSKESYELENIYQAFGGINEPIPFYRTFTKEIENKLTNQKTSTVFIAQKYDTFQEFVEKHQNILKSNEILSSTDNHIAYLPRDIVGKDYLKRYQNVVLLDGFLSRLQLHTYADVKNIYIQNKQHSTKLLFDHSTFGIYYRIIEKYASKPNNQNNVHELLDKIKLSEKLNEAQFAICLFTFIELNLIKLTDNQDGFSIEKIDEPSTKAELSKSKIFNEFQHVSK